MYHAGYNAAMWFKNLPIYLSPLTYTEKNKQATKCIHYKTAFITTQIHNIQKIKCGYNYMGGEGIIKN